MGVVRPCALLACTRGGRGNPAMVKAPTTFCSLACSRQFADEWDRLHTAKYSTIRCLFPWCDQLVAPVSKGYCDRHTRGEWDAYFSERIALANAERERKHADG
jgi:hypothetical protein